MRPFRFGISFGGAPTRHELVTAIKRAEASGFSVVLTADHISSRLAVMPLLSFAAEISSMRVSPLVIANDYRHPAIVARDAATLDILSEGRFELGIGTGWIKPQYEQAGIPYDSPGTRVDRFSEAINVIKGSWSGEPYSFTGEHYRVRNLTCPKPMQTPYPPLLIAASGERMCRVAGAEADIVDISPLGRVAEGFDHYEQGMAVSGDRIDDQLRWIRAGAGERFDELELSVMAHHFEIADDVGKRADKLANEWSASPDQILASPHIFLGSKERIIETLLERRERYGISYVIFSGYDLDETEPIVAALAGT